MEAKHTKGPWSWWTSNSLMRLSGADGKDGGVLHAYMHSGLPDISVREANARLIAAAPELLEALQTLAAEEFRDDDDPILAQARAKARAAIAKATGGE